MGKPRRDASKIDVERLCSQYMNGVTVRELSNAYGFDSTTITNRLRAGMGEEAYKSEVTRRQKLQYHVKQPEAPGIELSRIHWLVRSHWGRPATDEINQLARELRNETDH